MATQEDLYHFHSENFRAVARGFEKTLELLKDAVGADDSGSVDSLARIGAFLLSAKTESRFYKLLYEPPVPDEFREVVDRVDAGRRPSLITKWQRTVDLAFKEYYDVSGDFRESTGYPEATEQHALHHQAISQLKPIIELRNKVAHGQWRYALNSLGTDLNPAKTRQLEEESLLTLTLKDRLAGSVADAVNDLVVSKKAHDRDLEIHRRRLESTLRELKTRSYDAFSKNIRDRAERAQNRRRAAVGKPPL